MKSLFKIVSIATAALFLYLFAELFFRPDAFVEGLGLTSSVGTAVLCRRAAMFMLGIVVLMFGLRNLQVSTARQWVCLSTAFTLFGLSCIGTYHFFTESVNSSILIAITIESVLWILYAYVILLDRRFLKKQDGKNI